MYNLPYHKERDQAVVESFIDDHPFAFLTGCDAQGRPVATQVPLFLEDDGGRQVLRGHLMRNTDHHRAFQHSENVLAVFTGAQSYVSGTWYSDPHTPSTWNYMSVHARGTIRFLEGAALEDMLRKTSLHFEGGDAASPTVYDNLPPALTQRLVKMIVAFEITVTGMDTVFKLSQDRDLPSYRNIIERLRERGENGRAIADEMEKREKQVFP
jgi:transcriptional regulator